MTQPATPLNNRDSINALVSLIRSNAQAIASNSDNIAATREAINTTNAGIHELTKDVQLLRKVTDDVASESAATEATARNNSANIESLLSEARADRQRSDQRWEELKAEAQADRAQWQANFDAQQEVLQRLLLEIRSTNGELKQLGDRVTNLEAG